MDNNILVAFGLTLFAGLSTGIGSVAVLFVRRSNAALLAFGLGFSSGVMVFVSLAELLPQGAIEIAHTYGEKPGQWIALAAFMGGMLITMGIDALVPEALNPHEPLHADEVEHVVDGDAIDKVRSGALGRVGLISAIAIAAHNLPEGMATFMTSISDPQLGLTIAIAVAIHNIPEGIAVALPVFFATGSRKKAFGYSMISGLAEPLGCGARLPHLAPLHQPHRFRAHASPGRRRYGLHLLRRAPTHRARIWQRSHRHPRGYGRHGGDGQQPHPADVTRRLRRRMGAVLFFDLKVRRGYWMTPKERTL